MGRKQYELRAAPVGGPAEGETIRLAAEGAIDRRDSCRMGGFPWWTLWLIWPLIGLAKGLVFLVAPLLGLLLQPTALLVSPLALLLIGAGVALLLVGRRERR